MHEKCIHIDIHIIIIIVVVCVGRLKYVSFGKAIRAPILHK